VTNCSSRQEIYSYVTPTRPSFLSSLFFSSSLFNDAPSVETVSSRFHDVLLLRPNCAAKSSLQPHMIRMPVRHISSHNIIVYVRYVLITHHLRLGLQSDRFLSNNFLYICHDLHIFYMLCPSPLDNCTNSGGEMQSMKLVMQFSWGFRYLFYFRTRI
jgi:hypothetical protein